MSTEPVDLTDIADTLETYRQAKAEIAKWKDVAAAAEERIKAKLGDAETGKIHGLTAVTWKMHDDTRLDTKRLRADLPPALLAPYMTTKPVRRFEVRD